MAMNFAGGGLFQEPTDKTDEKPKTTAELERDLAVLRERNAQLENQTKIQRDSFLQLNQHSTEQARMMRDQLQQQVSRQHPGVIPQAPASAPPSDNWEDLVNAVAGGTRQPPAATAQAPGMPVDPNTLKQLVRQTILDEAQAAERAQAQERQQQDQLVHQFRVQYPDLASNKKFTAEADRVFVGLRQQGLSVEQAWGAALQEAAHIHKNYSQRRQPQEEEQQQQQPAHPRAVPGAAYMFPMGIGGGPASSKGGKESNMIIDMRPPAERFAEAAKEISASRLAAAKRAGMA